MDSIKLNLNKPIFNNKILDIFIKNNRMVVRLSINGQKNTWRYYDERSL